MCHATPYASRQKLNTDIGIIQLATRILVRGTQRRPRMIAQGRNLNVRPRKLSPVSSFRADRECGSSGPSTLSHRALSGRSLRAFFAVSWALLAHLLSSHRASEQRNTGRQHGPNALMSFRFGWGGAVPPMEGARLPRRPAHPFRLGERPCVLVLLVRARRHGPSTRRHTRWCH